LPGVTVGAIYQWEQGLFEPRNDKKGGWWLSASLAAEIKKLLEEKKMPDHGKESSCQTCSQAEEKQKKPLSRKAFKR
jgi:hypothetical protein